MSKIKKISDSSVVCRVIQPNTFVGVAVDKDPSSVLITLNENAALKYQMSIFKKFNLNYFDKVSNQKELYQWNTRKKFQCCVVYDFVDHKYVALFSNNSLRVWSENDFFIDRIKQIKFQSPIYALIGDKNKSPLVLFKNGFVSRLNECLPLRKQDFESDIMPYFDEIIDYSILSDESSKTSLALLLEMNETIAVIFFEIVDNDIEKIEKIHFERNGLELQSFLLTNTNNGMLVLNYWSDHQLYCKSISSNAPNTLLANFEDIFETDSNEKIAMKNVSDNLIVLYGRSKNSKTQCTLLLYNIQLKMIENQQSFANDNHVNQIWIVDTNLYVVHDQNLKLLQIEVTKQTLESLMGSICDQQTIFDNNGTMFVIDSSWKSFDKLIDKCHLKKIEKKVNEMSDLSEPILAKLIAFTLSKYNFEFISVDDYEIQRNSLLETLLNFDYDSIQISSVLKKELTITQVIDFLNYLYVLFVSTKQYEKLQWCLTLFDCFHTELILHHNKKKISDLVRHFTTFSDQFLEHSEPYFETEIVIKDLLRCGCFDKSITFTSDCYQIEYLQFDIQFD